MTERTVYQSNDGKIFNNRNECYIYERALSINGAIRVIKSFCNAVQCDKCPFYLNSQDVNRTTCMFTESKPTEWKEV